MATTLVPETVPTRAGSASSRLTSVRANLMPDEVIVARRTEALRKRVLMGLAALVAIAAAAYGASWVQTASARGDLSDLQHRATALLDQQNEFAPLVQAQAGAQTIQSQVGQLMADDLPWKRMLGNLRSRAPKGVVLTAVNATLTATDTTVAGSAPTVPLGAGTALPVGTLNVSGTAQDKNAVAAYADHLAKVKGLAAPLITNVAAAKPAFSFTMNVVITSDAFGGRYAVAPTTSSLPGAPTATTPALAQGGH